MPLHLVFEKEDAPSTRIRLVQMAPFLEREGIACRIAPYPRTAAGRRDLAAALTPGDAVLFHRVRPGRRDARWWRSLPAKRLYDFDDAVMFGRRRGWRGAWERQRRRRGFARALESVDAATPGNAFLASHASGLPCRVVPSAVRIDVPRHAPRAAPARLRIGWVGRASNWGYVSAIAPALERVAAARPIEVMAMSEHRVALPRLPVRWVPWSAKEEAATVAGFDVGIMPLARNEVWSRGKCAYKLLQYLAAGVPAVASDVGANRDILDDGVNGLLITSLEAWTEALLALADDDGLRERLSAAGRATAPAYGYAAVAAELADFLRTLEPHIASR